MRLSEFIVTNREQILIEWEAFAGTLGPASDTMDIAGLRDHASEMLTVIAKDLETDQSGREQAEKAVGQAPDAGHAQVELLPRSDGEPARVGRVVELHRVDRRRASIREHPLRALHEPGRRGPGGPPGGVAAAGVPDRGSEVARRGAGAGRPRAVPCRSRAWPWRP